MTELDQQNCQAYSGLAPMNADELAEPLSRIQHWGPSEDFKSISKNFHFKNYYQTTAFVNAVIYIAHQQDHHPDIQFSYNSCVISFSTHSIGGLSMNDFICAARIDRLNTYTDT